MINEVENIVKHWILECLKNESRETNDLFLYIVEKVYKERIVIDDINFFDLLTSVAKFENNLWSI